MKLAGASLILMSLILLVPFTTSAETGSSSDCQVVQAKMKQARNTQAPLKLQREQTKERVHDIYQDLLVCHSTNLLNKSQRLYCQELQQEAPKQFQAMLKLVTTYHKGSIKIQRLTKQVQKFCPTPNTKLLTHITQFAIR